MVGRMPSSIEPVECVCGAEMELRTEGVHRLVPLVGSEVEYRGYACPDCRRVRHYERAPGEDEWEHATA